MLEDILGAILGGIAKWLGEVLFSIFKDEKEPKYKRFIAITIAAGVPIVMVGGLIVIAKGNTTWTIIGWLLTSPFIIWYLYWLLRIFFGIGGKKKKK